ncbi:hypothetical protein TNCV_509371 [Trichonephila clavipes]|nr:hypothetical protein TNCV_509371 [Trichonephila clavipes]
MPTFFLIVRRRAGGTTQDLINRNQRAPALTKLKIKKIYTSVIMPTFLSSYVRSEGPRNDTGLINSHSVSGLTKIGKIKKIYTSVIMPTCPPSYVRSEGPEERHRFSSGSENKKDICMGYNTPHLKGRPRTTQMSS